MTSFPFQSFKRMRERAGVMSDIFAFGNLSGGLSVTADGQIDLASGQAVSGNYFAGLGVQPLLGRLLTDEDDKPSASPVAVLSHRYWQQRFSGDAAIIGKQINLNKVAFTVVGVEEIAVSRGVLGERFRGRGGEPSASRRLLGRHARDLHDPAEPFG